MINSDYKVQFSNRGEIRMGSPYYYADLKISNLEIELPKVTWQDKFAISKDSKTLVLVSYDLTDNEPGFRFNIINTLTKSIRQSERISGLLNNLKINENIIHYNKFLFNKTEKNNAKKNFNIDEEFRLK